jgi:hypothetical protein
MMEWILVGVIFILTFVASYIVYCKKSKELIVYHQYSYLIDILAFFSGSTLVFIAFQFYNTLASNNTLFFILQVLSGLTLFNIHLARFIIHLKTKDKFAYKR